MAISSHKRNYSPTSLIRCDASCAGQALKILASAHGRRADDRLCFQHRLLIGLHFIGVMDLTIVVYSVGLVFGFIIVPAIFVPVWADQPNAMSHALRLGKVALMLLSVFFTVGLFLPSRISIMSLFAIYFTLATIVGAAMVYVSWASNDVRGNSVFLLCAGALFAVFWVGGAIADHEAFSSGTLYRVVAKTQTYDGVRLVRSSSSGFLIVKDKQVIYLPSGELTSIALTTLP
jgi:hypothetical protein